MKHRKKRILRLLPGAGVALVVGIVLVLAYSVWDNLEMKGHDRHRPDAAAADWVLPRVPDNGRYVLLLMIDGLSVPAYETALAAGRMPHLQELVQRRPTSSVQAISTFPSATSPSVQEMLSGRYAELDYLASPGAVHAFDRRARRIVRYVTEPDSWQWPVPTLFDAVKGRPAITVFEGRWDGPTTILTQYNMAGQAILAALGASALSNGDLGPVQAYLDVLRSGELPVVALVVLNEFDVAAHFHGPDSAQALEALSDCDALLGRIIETMKQVPGRSGGSLLDDTSILVFGDHGMVASGQFVDLPDFFTNLGVNAVDVSTIPHVVFRERLGTLWTQWPDAILVAGGSNVTQVYLRRPSGSWSDDTRPSSSESRRKRQVPPTDTLIHAIAELDGIGQVLRLRDDGSIHVRDLHSEASVIERWFEDERRYAYVVPAGAARDPFDYLGDETTARLVCRGDAQTDSCFHSSQLWTDQTAASRYPAAVPLLPKAFRPTNFAGDLIVTAKPGYSFLRNQNGDHGNLERDAMLTPLILNGPGVRPCVERHVPRLVDIYPTTSVLLGADPADGAFRELDGRVLDCVREPSGALIVEQ